MNPLAVVLHEGRWHLHAPRSRRRRTAHVPAVAASSAASTPIAGSTFDAPPPGIQDRSDRRPRTNCACAMSPISPSLRGSDAEVRLGKRAVARDEDAGRDPAALHRCRGVRRRAGRLRARGARARTPDASRRCAASGCTRSLMPIANPRPADERRPAAAEAAESNVRRRRPTSSSSCSRSCRTCSNSEVVDVAEAAAHFGSPTMQIRDAVKLIAMSGLPGATGTYQPNDLFDIDWDAFEDDDEIVIVHHVAIDDAPRLSAREAAALIAGLQYLRHCPRTPTAPHSRRCMAKLDAGASATPDAHRRRPRPKPTSRSRSSAKPSPTGANSSSTTATPSARRPSPRRPAARRSRKTPTGTCRRTATPAKTCATSASTA